MTMDTSFSLRDVQRRRLMEQLEESSKFEAQGAATRLLPSSFTNQAAAGALSDLSQLGRVSNLNVGLTDTLGLASLGLSSGVPSQMDYAAAIQQKLLEEQTKRELIAAQVALLGSQQQPDMRLPGLQLPLPQLSQQLPQRGSANIDPFLASLLQQKQKEGLGLRSDDMKKDSSQGSFPRKRKRVDEEVSIVDAVHITNSKESKAMYPLPRATGDGFAPALGSLSSFKNKWNNLTEDTSSLKGEGDSEAVVKLLFRKALYDTNDLALGKKRRKLKAKKKGLPKRDA